MNKNHKKLGQNGNISLLVILLIVLVLVSGVGYYVWHKNRNNNQKENRQASASSQKATAEATKTSPTPATAKAIPTCTEPSAAEIADIKAAVTSGNTAALEGYMAATVKVILAATEGIGDQTPAQAVADVTTFISDTSAWNFALPAATITSYKGTPYATYFPTNAIIGKDSGTTKVISFSFDCDGKINVVFEAGQESLLL